MEFQGLNVMHALEVFCVGFEGFWCSNSGEGFTEAQLVVFFVFPDVGVELGEGFSWVVIGDAFDGFGELVFVDGGFGIIEFSVDFVGDVGADGG
jgi:hypothetical protein